MECQSSDFWPDTVGTQEIGLFYCSGGWYYVSMDTVVWSVQLGKDGHGM